MNYELKPCPFCGARPDFYAINFRSGDIHGNGEVQFAVRCLQCDMASTKKHVTQVRMDTGGNFIFPRDERQNAVDEWNRRS